LVRQRPGIRQGINGLMPPELVRDDIVMRVEGDMLEIAIPRTENVRRIPLAWLVVRAQPARKNNVQVCIGSENVDQPLYEMKKKTAFRGQSLITFIKADEEPAYRAFFAEVAQLCGRSVTPASQS
jgi:hypothetical protein